MDRVRSLIRYQRFQKVIGIVRGIIALAFIVALIAALGRVVLRFSTVLNQNSGLLLSILTFILVIVTALYVWITFRMLLSMVRARTKEIRPFLSVDLFKPEVLADETQLSILVRFKLTNYSAAPAIATHVVLTIPWKKDATTKNEWISSEPAQPIPTIFEPGVSCEGNVKFFVYQYTTEEEKSSFLEVEASYEDIERNMYWHREFYDLVPFKTDNRSYTWKKRYEELKFLAVENRRFVIDRNRGILRLPDRRKIIFQWIRDV